MGTITPEHFEALFASSIRTQFNWRGFRRERWPVRLDVIDAHPLLGELRLPWCVDDNGNSLSLMAPGAKPLRVKDVPAMLPRFPEKRTGEILDLARSYMRQRYVSTVMAGYRTMDGVLLLDGCHRSSALFVAKPTGSYRIAMFTVCGPDNVGALIDLEHVLFPESSP